MGPGNEMIFPSAARLGMSVGNGNLFRRRPCDESIPGVRGFSIVITVCISKVPPHQLRPESLIDFLSFSSSTEISTKYLAFISVNLHLISFAFIGILEIWASLLKVCVEA